MYQLRMTVHIPEIMFTALTSGVSERKTVRFGLHFGPQKSGITTSLRKAIAPPARALVSVESNGSSARCAWSDCGREEGEVLEGWSEFIRSARDRSCKHRRRRVPPQLQRLARRSHTRGAWIPARAATTASVTTVGSSFSAVKSN